MHMRIVWGKILPGNGMLSRQPLRKPLEFVENRKG